MHQNKNISIYDYLDYRQYLSDLFQLLKEKQGLTLRFFAHKAGFSSHSFLNEIIKGKKTVSVQAVWKIAKGFSLSEDESNYLELLVRFNQAQDHEERDLVYKRINKLRPFTEISKLEKAHYHLFSKWYIFAIRELVAMPDFREDYQWLAKQLKPIISTNQAKEAIELLLELGLLIRNERNNLEQATPELTTGPEVSSLFISNYHQSLLGLAAYALKETKSQWRDFSSLSFILSKDDFQFIKKRVVEFRREILQYIQDKRKGHIPDSQHSKDSVLYYLNMQLFNASKIDWPEQK